MLVYGTAYWAHLNVPYKFDDRDVEKWTITLVPEDQNTIEEFRDKGIYIKKDKETGEESVTFKRNVFRKNGQPNQKPKLVGVDKTPIDVNVGNGSRVCVQYREYEYTFRGKPGVGLDLQGVQVLDLKEYASDDGAEFENHDEDSEF